MVHNEFSCNRSTSCGIANFSFLSYSRIGLVSLFAQPLYSCFRLTVRRLLLAAVWAAQNKPGSIGDKCGLQFLKRLRLQHFSHCSLTRHI